MGRASCPAISRYWLLSVVSGDGESSGTLWKSRESTLTVSEVLQAVKRLCDQSGVRYKGVHAFRRTAAAEMKRLGMQDSDIL